MTKPLSLQTALDAKLAELRADARKAGSDQTSVGNRLHLLYAIRDEVSLLEEVHRLPFAALLYVGGKLTFPRLGVVVSGDEDIVDRSVSVTIPVTVTALDGRKYFKKTGATGKYTLHERDMQALIENIKVEFLASGVLDLKKVRAASGKSKR